VEAIRWLKRPAWPPEARLDAACLLLSLLALVSYSRGYTTVLATWGEPYWFMNYHDGLVRRGMLGQVVALLFDQRDVDRIRSVALSAHFIASMVLLAGLWVWLRRLAAGDGGTVMFAAFGLFVGSQFLPRLAHDTGYLDVYVYGLVLLAVASVTGGSMTIAVVTGLLGPIVHEQFLFLWTTFAVLLLWDRTTPARVIVCIVPLVPSMLLYFGASKEAAMAQMAAAPLPRQVKMDMLSFQLGQTIGRALYIMQWNFRHYLDNFAYAAIFFVSPAALMVVTYASARKNARDTLALIAATMAPLGSLTVAWDLSRFLVGSAFSGLVATFYMQSREPVASVGRPMIATCWLVASFSFATPLIYAYFDVAAIEDHGVLPLSGAPLGQAARTLVARYTWGTDRYEPEPGATETDPPGTVWHTEEASWTGTWTRRPGTNIFDGVWTLGTSSFPGVLTIVRIGSAIRVTRRTPDGGETVYLGRLKGSKVSGHYVGGRWFATIQ
jgi:hypothetical protein